MSSSVIIKSEIINSKRFNKSKFTHDKQLKKFDDVCGKITDQIIDLYQNTDEEGESYNDYISDDIYNYTDIMLISSKLVRFCTKSFYEDTHTFDQRLSTITELFEILCEINNENKVSLSYTIYKKSIKNIDLSEELQNLIINVLNSYLIDIIQKLK
jgi:hypothetical protein